MSQDRNQPCPCGSGKKYKNCCAHKRSKSQWATIVAAAGFLLVVAWGVSAVIQDAREVDWSAAPPQKVWSEEHGHWHTVGGTEEQPDGEAPPGKVWSEEHGHWHDAPAVGADEQPQQPTDTEAAGEDELYPESPSS